MRIAQTTTLHWGGLPNMDYQFGTHTLLAGETGSGKTSFIDVVVAVLSGGGGGSRQSKFNIAQTQLGQSSKKSRRNLPSYIIGSNGMGRFLRAAGAHGYVAVAWDKDQHDGTYGTPFTAIIGAEATLDRDIEKTPTLNSDVVRLLVRGHIVGLADLLSVNGTVLPAAELIVSLRAKYGSHAVRDFRSAGEYLAMLYAYLKGDTTPVSREEADQACKAFVSAIAYRQPDDIDGLIREEILDTVDNESLIQRLIETIREVTRLKDEAARMEGNIVQLEVAEAELLKAFDAFMDERMFKALIDIRKAEETRESLSQSTSDRDHHNGELAKIVSSIDIKNQEQAKRQEALSDLRVRIKQNDAVREKEKLEAFIGEQDRDMDTILNRVSSATESFGKVWRDAMLMQGIVHATPDLAGHKATIQTLIEQLALVSLPALQASIQGVRDGLSDSPLAEMTKNCKAIIEALTAGWDTAINGDAGLRAAFNVAYRSADQAFTENKTLLGDIRRRAEKLKVGEIEYPPAVELFLKKLQEELPKCKARVLCDVVEVTDSNWQAAIEGYLGRDRFTILYDRDYETEIVAKAKEFRRQHAGYRGDISVPQLSLAIQDRPHVETNSIVHLLKINADAEAAGYLKVRYGRTVTVRDTVVLKTTRSGIMQDGWSTQGYRYQQRRISDDELVFGAEIRRRQREALLKRETEIAAEINKLEGRRQQLNNALAATGGVSVLLTVEDPTKFDEAAQLRLMAAHDLASLDLSSVEGLMEKAAAMQRDLDTQGHDIQELRKQEGGIQTTIGVLGGQITKLQAELSTLDPKAQAATAEHEVLMQRAFMDLDGWPARFANEHKARRSVDGYDSRSRGRTTIVSNAVNDVNTKLGEYNRDALEHQRLQIPLFAYDPQLRADVVVFWMEDVWRKMREQIRAQKETGLPERLSQCEMAERSFTSSFTTDFCATVLSNVEGRDDTIITLNANLERINFGGDRYKLISNMKLEYSDYIDLFRKIRSLTEARRADLDLFNAPEFEPSERDTLLRIRELLLDERDTDRALEELRRIADYRNYRTYDFTRSDGEDTVVLSKWGTGSGGESETPIYVIRVAVMASAFKLFSQQKKAHFRSIFMDEVFATMDETRTRRVLRFLKELGLQIVCAAPTRAMAAVLDEFDTRINFSKYPTPNGNCSDVNVINLHEARVRALYETHRNSVAKEATATFEKTEASLRVVLDEEDRATGTD